MINLKKSVAVSLSVIMLFSTCILSTSCKKKPTGKVVTVSEDSPWYTAEWCKISGDEESDPNIDYFYREIVGCTDDALVVNAWGSYKIPDGAWEEDDFNYDAYSINRIEYYSFSGELMKSIDFQSVISEEATGMGFDSFQVTFDGITDEAIQAILWGYKNENNYSEEKYMVSIDPATSSIISISDASDNNDIDEEASSEGSMEAGDGYSIDKYWIADGSNYSYILDINAPDGSSRRLDLRDEFPNISFYDISNTISMDATHCLINPSLDNHDEAIYFIIDLENGTIEIDDADYSWLDQIDAYNIKYFAGIGNAVTNENGIGLIDFDNQELTEQFNFSMCNINRSKASNLSLYSYSEDRIVLAGSTYESETGIEYKSNTYILVLTKAETNPNAGKTILTAASLLYLDDATSEAIVDFNEANSEYFVVLTDKYNVSSYFGNDTLDEDADLEIQSLEAQASMSNQLAIDLIAGDGPDIIIGGMDYRQLNNSDYLLDLSDYYAGIEGNYFTNVIDAAKVDNKLYQMPLSFMVSGIRTDLSNVNAGQVGFTFEEYNEFVDEVCNGKAPLNLGQLDFFTTAIVGMNDLFVDNGNINYDCEEFRDFALFVKDNINEIPEETDIDDYYYGIGTTTENAVYTTISSFGNYIGWDYVENKTLLGIPSYDGRGPIIDCSSSIAISAETASPDACWEFIKTLLSEEVQKNYASESCPVNADAFRDIAEIALSEKNAEVEEYASYYSPEELLMFGYVTVDESAIDQYMEIMASATTISSVDAAIQKILREEMPAYFSGQKSIDEVLDIIQDKVQTYLNERG